MTMHKLMAETMDTVIEEIKAIQKNARENNNAERPVWPMIVLRTPKGWTGPKVVDGKQIEGSFRAHQVPLTMESPEHLDLLKEWLESYHAEELFDENGRLIPELQELAPKGNAPPGCQPPRQRRPAAEGPAPARLPQSTASRLIPARPRHRI